MAKFKHYKAGDEIGITALKNQYGAYAVEVLGGDHLRRIERGQAKTTTTTPKGRTRSRRLPAKFKVLKELPTPGEFNALKIQKYETTVESLVGDGYGEVECLADEMREWHDGMGENLQCSDTGTRVGEAADLLENVNDPPELPSALAELKLVFYPALKITSRSDRCSDAACRLREAGERINEYIGDENLNPDEGTGQEYQEYADQLANHADELEGADFPGMYG